MIELDGTMIGAIELNRRDAEQRSQIRPDAGEAELGYLLLAEVWGHGYATEACSTVQVHLGSVGPSTCPVPWTAGTRSARQDLWSGAAPTQRR